MTERQNREASSDGCEASAVNAEIANATRRTVREACQWQSAVISEY